MFIPVRKPVTRSKGRVVGYFASYKNRRMLPWESQLERDFLMSLEVDPQVEAFGVQPQTFEYRSNGSSRRYTPDVYVQYEYGASFVEVKAHNQAKKPRNQAFFQKMTDYFGELGFGFDVYTEKHIRKEPKFSNMHLILAQRLGFSEELDRGDLQDFFGRNQCIPLHNLSVALCKSKSPLAGLRFVAGGLATLDLDTPIFLRQGAYLHD